MARALNSVIRGVDYYVPKRVVSNDDLAEFMDTSDEWIRERTGIRERRFAASDQGTSDLAVAACSKLLEKLAFDPKDLDLILMATISPDHYFPGVGVQVQERIGAGNVPAIDVRGQCSGFSWILSQADAYIKSGMYKKVLVVGAELQSRLMDITTRGRNVGVLFGDGAGALLVEAQAADKAALPSNTQRGIIDHKLGSDGSGLNLLAMLRPGLGANTSTFASPEEIAVDPFAPTMDGRAVFRNAVRRMSECTSALLKRHGLTSSDIDLLIPHQANMRINETLRQKLDLPPEKVHNCIERYGNTTAATIPIGLGEACELGKLKKGDLVVTVAFGSGFTWGANLIRW